MTSGQSSEFEELCQKGEDLIREWIAERRREGQHLDCKGRHPDATADLTGPDEKNLVKAVSAFANSGGGIILWGVVAKRCNGIDCLTEMQPIRDIEVFRTNVEHRLSDLIAPPVPEVQIHTIPAREHVGAGYLAIWVPDSDERPHMARGQYYFRSGHKSEPMLHYQVRDQMLRRSQARLQFDWAMRVETPANAVAAVKRHVMPVYMDLLLINTSRVSARAPFLRVQYEKSAYAGMGPAYTEFAKHGLSVAQFGPLDERPADPVSGTTLEGVEFIGRADYCVHPGVSLRIARLDLPVEIMVNDLDPHIVGQRPTTTIVPKYDTLPFVIMNISFGCMDTDITVRSFRIPPNEMREKITQSHQDYPITLPYVRR